MVRELLCLKRHFFGVILFKSGRKKPFRSRIILRAFISIDEQAMMKPHTSNVTATLGVVGCA